MSPNLFPNNFESIFNQLITEGNSHDSKDESNTDIEVCKQSEPRPSLQPQKLILI